MYLLSIVLASITSVNPQFFPPPGFFPSPEFFSIPELIPLPTEEYLEAAFEIFRHKYHKNYETHFIEQLRKAIFKVNFKDIILSNRNFNKGMSTFFTGPNEYIDLTPNEYNSALNGFGKTCFNKKLSQPRAKLGQAPRTKIPERVDWRETGEIGPVKNQRGCSSCYAFSAAAAVAAQVFRKTGKLYDLSPQNIVDCSTPSPYDNDGCIGGYPDYTFQYILDRNGVNIDRDYPYEAQLKQCRFESNTTQGKIVEYRSLRRGDEKELEAAVANIGPISAAMDATHDTFLKYKGGIYYEPKCGNRVGDLNHAILVIGYGVDNATGAKYWLCKNTYGSDWGENGYFRIAKERGNHCGIATWALYPVV